MMYLPLVWLVVGNVCVGRVWAQGDGVISMRQGYKLPNNVQYVALSPRRVRPDAVFPVHLLLFSLPHSEAGVTLRAVLSQDGREYASVTRLAERTGSHRLQMKVPVTVTPGVHKLEIAGFIGTENALFMNSTTLHFSSKYITVLIQTDRPVYYSSPIPNDGDDWRGSYAWPAIDKVKFRVLGMRPNLQPVSGPITVYVKDGQGNVVRRYLQRQLHFGIFEGSFKIANPVHTGKWQIVVEAFNHVYEQDIRVINYHQQRFEVNVTTPVYVFNTEWGIVGQLRASYLSGADLFGNATIHLRVRDAGGELLDGDITRRLAYIKGTTQFSFSLGEIQEKFGPVHNKSLVFTASVYDEFWMETNTGTSVTNVIKDGIVIKLLGPKFRTFKPRVPFSIYLAVTRSDGTPYAGFLNRQVILTTVHTGGSGAGASIPEKKMIVPDDAIVRFEVQPGADDRRIQIRAFHPATGQGVDLDCYRYWSPTNRYISVTTSTSRPRVDEYMVFTLRTNFFTPEIHYLIMAGGTVLLGSQVAMSSQQKTLSVAMDRDMAPRARLVVYAVVDGEVLVDSLNFFVDDSRLTKTSLTLNKGKDFVWDSVELVGRGTPGAFLSISGMDYEFYRRGAATGLRKETIIRELATFDEPNEGPYHYSWYYNDARWEETVYFTAPSSGVDHLTTFNVSGIAALSDMNLTATPESHNCNATLGLGRCLSGECYELKYKCDGKVDCVQDAVDELDCYKDIMPPERAPALDDLHYTSRYFFDNDWLWHTTYIKHTGQVEWKTPVPKNFGAYVAGAFVLDREEGLAITTETVHHDARRAFYMRADAPSSSRRGEQLGVTCTLFNEWHEQLEVLLTLHGSEDYRFINVEEYGWANAYSPRLTAGDVQTMVELSAGENKIVHLPVVPVVEQGELVVALSAYSLMRRDVVTLNITVTYDGVTNDNHIPYLVDLVNQGSIIIPDFDIPIPERWFIPNQRDLLYVPGSNYARLQIWGNVAAPGFFKKALNVERTMSLPYDCTDAFTFDVAINLFTLKYLQIINALEQDKAKDALDYMKFVLPRLYAYKQEDGSFKQFEKSTNSTVWLSAFVLNTLHELLSSEWNEDAYVEVELLNDIALWLIKQQDPETGAFKETSEWYYLRALWPNSTDDEGKVHDWHIPVTAYVTIVLAGTDRLTGGVKGSVESARQRSAEYLAGKLASITDPLQMAMTAYALHKTNHRAQDDAFVKFRTMARITQYVYWADKEIPENPTRIVNTVPFQESRLDHPNMWYANMATAYGLMLYLANNLFEESKPIMRWLQTQHNDFYAYSSTMDALVVLDSLREYAYRETNRDIYQMEVRIESTKDPAWRHVLMLNQSNLADLHEFYLPKAWGQIKIRASGTGYAFIHAGMYHNVEKEYLIRGPAYDSIGFETDNLVYRGRNGSIVELTACIRWLRPDIAPLSGQAFYQINIPTGYVVSWDAIHDLYAQQVPGLMKAAYRQDSLWLNFAYISQERTCMTIQMDRWYPVANMSYPHLVWLFEYQENGLQLKTMYETYGLFSNHICLVCGSYQCPYCPYYNSAPVLAVSQLSLNIIFISVLNQIWHTQNIFLQFTHL